MKTFANTTALITLFFVLTLAACTKESNTVPLPESMVTSYTGDLSYTAGINIIANNNGTATIAKTGDTYTISFSDNVPSITGIQFSLEQNGDYASVALDGSTTGISIDETTFSIGVTKDGKTWAFTGQ